MQRSFHRTMTQVASDESVRGHYDGVALELDRGTMNLPRSQRRFSLLTGSHQKQAYWVDNRHGNQQFSLTFTYLVEQDKGGASRKGRRK